MFGGFQKGEIACLLIRKIFEGLERTVGGSYFFLFTGEGWLIGEFWEKED